MFCDLESHFKQQYEALLVSLCVFVGPSLPIVQQLAEQMSKLEAPKPPKQ